MDALSIRIARAISRIVRWSVISSSTEDVDPYPTQGINYLGKDGIAQIWYPYGFNAHAPRGSLNLMWAMAADSNAYVAMPGSPQERVKVAEGEVVMYHPKTGAKVHMKEDGSILIDSPTSVDVEAVNWINLTAPFVNVSDELTTGGDVDVTGQVTTSSHARIGGAIIHTGGQLGFHSSTPVTQQTITGGSGGVPALINLLTALDAMGIIVDGT